MPVLAIVIPLALLIAIAAVIAFIWVVRSGQLDDLETPPLRVLFDDEPAAPRADTALPTDDDPDSGPSPEARSID